MLTAWLPAMRNITTAMTAVIPSLTYFPVSAGGRSLLAAALYKTALRPGVAN